MGRGLRIPGAQPGDIPTALSPDGDTLVLLRTQSGSGGDVYALSMRGAWPPRPLVQTPGYDGGGGSSGRPLAGVRVDRLRIRADLPRPVSSHGSQVAGLDAQRHPGALEPERTRDLLSRRKSDDDGGSRCVRVDVRLSSPKLLLEQPLTTGAYVTTANYDVTADGGFVILQAETWRAPAGGHSQLVRRAEDQVPSLKSRAEIRLRDAAYLEEIAHRGAARSPCSRCRTHQDRGAARDRAPAGDPRYSGPSTQS